MISKTTKRWFRRKAPFSSTITPTWDNWSPTSSTWTKTTPPTWNTWRGDWTTRRNFTGTTWQRGTANFAWSWQSRRVKRHTNLQTEEGNSRKVKFSSRWMDGFTMKKIKSVFCDLLFNSILNKRKAKCFFTVNTF